MWCALLLQGLFQQESPDAFTNQIEIFVLNQTFGIIARCLSTAMSAEDTYRASSAWHYVFWLPYFASAPAQFYCRPPTQRPSRISDTFRISASQIVPSRLVDFIHSLSFLFFLVLFEIHATDSSFPLSHLFPAWLKSAQVFPNSPLRPFVHKKKRRRPGCDHNNFFFIYLLSILLCCVSSSTVNFGSHLAAKTVF